jgi:hypothetical protein
MLPCRSYLKLHNKPKAQYNNYKHQTTHPRTILMISSNNSGKMMDKSQCSR